MEENYSLFRTGSPPLAKRTLGSHQGPTHLKGPPNPPHVAERMRDRIMAVKELTRLFHRRYSILGWVEGPAAEAANLRGVTNFLFDLMDDRDFCRGLMECCTDVGISFALAQIEAGGPILSASVMPLSVKFPLSLQTADLPASKRLIEAIQGAGALVRLHICGNISKHLPVLKNLHVDILDLDWPVDLTYARSVMGDTVLVSNSNPVADIQQGTMAQIEEQIEAMYVTAGNPFLIGGRAAKYPWVRRKKT